MSVSLDEKTKSTTIHGPHISPPPAKRQAKRSSFAAWMRWLHIYLSMLGFTALIFFSVTGITLNHADWFFADSSNSVNAQGQLDAAWLAPGATDLTDASVVDRLSIVEWLRTEHGIKGALSEFSVDEYQCIVLFKGPGYSADIFVDRTSGAYDLTELRQGAIAILNDLHKGRDSGKAWSWLIDVSAVVMIVISISGLVLLLYIKRKWFSGLLTGVVGTVALVIVYWLSVP
ncbi:MAG: PepSY-associated TM helix domain-containing protein [Pirellulaceae bacterium]